MDHRGDILREPVPGETVGLVGHDDEFVILEVYTISRLVRLRYAHIERVRGMVPWAELEFMDEKDD